MVPTQILYILYLYILHVILALCSPGLVKPNKMLFLIPRVGQPLTEEYRALFPCQKYLCRIRRAAITPVKRTR